METVISLQHPAARLATPPWLCSPPRRCLGRRERGTTIGIPQAPAGRGDALVPPSHHLRRTMTFPAGILGISPFLQHTLGLTKSLFTSSLESVPECGWRNWSWHPSMLSIHTADKTPVALLRVLAVGQKCWALTCGFHLSVLYPAKTQKALLHLLAVFAILQSPWLFPQGKSTQTKCAANTKSGEKRSVREHR